jgi:hypothetical protein
MEMEYVPTLHETPAIVKHEFDPFLRSGLLVVHLDERGRNGPATAERTLA